MRSLRVAPVLALLSFAPSLRAEVVARAQVGPHTVTLERGARGAVTLAGVAGGAVTLSPGGDATLERVELARGAVALVARVASPASAVAVVAAPPGGAPAVVWRGVPDWHGEDVGERARDEVIVRDLDGDGARDVVVARRQRAVALCGLGHPLTDVRALDGATGRLAPLDVDPLRPELWEQGVVAPAPRAVTAVAGDDRAPALPRPRFVTGTADAAAPQALGDGNPETAWPTPRGAFATARLEYGPVEVRALDLVAPARGALARRWTVLLEPAAEGPAARLDVEVPDALARPGARVRVPLGDRVRARCVAVIAGDASPRGAPALAGLEVRTALDEPGVDAVATLVRAADGPSGIAAVRLLLALGDRGTSALADALPGMQPSSAREAVRLLDTARRPGVTAALVAALAREDLAPEAEASLLRHGEAALEPLARAVATTPRASGVAARLRAPVLARLRAVAPALDAEGEAWPAARAAFAGLLVVAARERETGGWLALVPASPRGASRALRMMSEALPPDDPARAALAARARAAWAEAEAFEHRWRLAPALAGDAEGRALLAAAARGDDADLRAEALRVLGAVPGADAHAALVAALDDRVPRVRASAARALRGRAGARPPLVGALTRDAWPTVRVAAVEALAEDAAAAPALVEALDQSSLPVVRAVLAALARNPGGGVAAPLVAFADDGRRNPTLRRDAVDALGARCDRAAVPGLERLAASLTNPSLPPYEQEIGHAALAALARIDPARARALLARSEANAAAAAAVARAIEGGCRR